MLRRALAAPVVVAVLVMVVWGATPVLTRIALEDMEPLVVATLRTILAYYPRSGKVYFAGLGLITRVGEQLDYWEGES